MINPFVCNYSSGGHDGRDRLSNGNNYHRSGPVQVFSYGHTATVTRGYAATGSPTNRPTHLHTHTLKVHRLNQQWLVCVCVGRRCLLGKYNYFSAVAPPPPPHQLLHNFITDPHPAVSVIIVKRIVAAVPFNQPLLPINVRITQKKGEKNNNNNIITSTFDVRVLSRNVHLEWSGSPLSRRPRPTDICYYQGRPCLQTFSTVIIIIFFFIFWYNAVVTCPTSSSNYDCSRMAAAAAACQKYGHRMNSLKKKK